MTTRLCGTCEFFKNDDPRDYDYGQCIYPLPEYLLVYTINLMHINEGTKCPAHKPRTPKEPK